MSVMRLKKIMEVITIHYKAPGRCPVCDHQLVVSKLTCTHCSTRLEGEFDTCEFCKLPLEQIEFIKVFLKCRGNIKDVEKELGISYPTVRGRLDTVIRSLGYTVSKIDTQEQEDEKSIQRRQIIDALDRGDINAKDAANQLKKMGK